MNLFLSSNFRANTPAKATSNPPSMRISELSRPELHRPSTDENSHPSHLNLLSEIESSINEIESLSFQDQTSLQNLVIRLTKSLSTSSSSLPLSDSAKIRVWKLSYRLWNACVDLANAANVLPAADRNVVAQAELRQIAAELLLLAKNPAGIPSPAFKSASFFHKTGLIWHDLGRLDNAAANFENATNLISSSIAESDDEKQFLLDINLARARTAWAANDRSLAIALLGRSKTILFGSPAAYQSLAEQYLQFGKLSLKTSCEDLIETSKLLSEALDFCEKGIAISTGGTLDLECLKLRCLRFMSAERLRAEDFEGVSSCVRLLRGIEGKEEEHPSVGYVALKACIGAGRVVEAEKELRGIMGNKRVPESACVSAAEAFLSAAGAEKGKEIMRMLMGRCKEGAGVALRVIRMVAGSDGCGVRCKIAMEMASDDRVVGLFVGNMVVKERNDMHALLWNWFVCLFLTTTYMLFSYSSVYVC